MVMTKYDVPEEQDEFVEEDDLIIEWKKKEYKILPGWKPKGGSVQFCKGRGFRYAVPPERARGHKVKTGTIKRKTR